MRRPAAKPAAPRPQGQRNPVRPRPRLRPDPHRSPTSRRPSRCGPTRPLERLPPRSSYPVFENLTWPGRIPFLALTSGTTQGATKYIPVSREMVASNRKAAQTMVAYHLAARPDSRLFHGRLFFLGGSARPRRARARRPPGRPERDRRGGAIAAAPALHLPAARRWPWSRTGTASSPCSPSGASASGSRWSAACRAGCSCSSSGCSS